MDTSQDFENSRIAWLQLAPSTAAAGYQNLNAPLETARRKTLEKYEKDLALVHDLEAKLEITVCWTPECEEWIRAANMVAMRRYQCALDQLEGLIVARMFELTKMNMSQTGAHFITHFTLTYY